MRGGAAPPCTTALELLLAGALPPEPLESVPGDARVVRRVLWIAVPEVILHGAQIGAPVGQVITATVPAMSLTT
jgi:hypothetical protein